MSVKVHQWEGIWYVVIHYRAKRYTKACESEKAAHDLADEMKTLIRIRGIEALARLKSSEPAGATTFGEYADQWIDEQDKTDLKATTIASYRYHVTKHLKPALEHLLLTEINYQTIKQFTSDQVDKKYSRDTIRLMIATLRAIMAEAVRDGLVDSNPVSALGRFYRKAERLHDEPEPFTAAEVEKVLSVVAQKKYTEWRGPVWIMAATGMRIGEVRGLKVDDLGAGTIWIRRNMPSTGSELVEPKTRASRRKVDIPADLQAYLRAMLLARKEQCFANGKLEPVWLFHNRTGGHLHYSNFYKAWRRILKDSGVSFRGFHQLRHTYASLALSRDPGRLLYVSQQLGHANPGITLAIYSRWIEETSVKTSVDVSTEKQEKR